MKVCWMRIVISDKVHCLIDFFFFSSVGDLEKYKSKGLFKKFQRRYCVLTPLALYYYESKKDQKQKGQIILPLSESTLRKGCHSFPEVKDKKLCFELGNEERSFLVRFSVITWSVVACLLACAQTYIGKIKPYIFPI